MLTTIYGDLKPNAETGKYHSEDFHALETAHFANKVNYRKGYDNIEDQINDRNILRARMSMNPSSKHIPTYIPQRERAFAPKEKFNKKFVSLC